MRTLVVAIPLLRGEMYRQAPGKQGLLRFLAVIVSWFLSSGGLPHQSADWFAMTGYLEQSDKQQFIFRPASVSAARKRPPSQWDRGRKIRGTTSNSALPHENALTVSDNTSRCVGRTRPPLLESSGGPLREVFGRLFLSPCTNRELSGGKWGAYFIPSQCLPTYPSKSRRVCQEKTHFSG